MVGAEISTLTQQFVSERGGFKSRLSEDSTAFWVANELNKELLNLIPDGRIVILTLRAPILKVRQAKRKAQKQDRGPAIQGESLIGFGKTRVP